MENKLRMELFRLECKEKFLLLKVSLSLSYRWKLYDPSPKTS